MRLSFAGILLLLSAGVCPAHEDLQIQIDRLTRQIEREPGRGVLYLRRGELHRMHEDWQAAREDLERAAALDPALIAADLSIGRVWNRCGDALRAKEALDRFLSREPGHAEALMERARSKVGLGDRVSALEDYSAALAAFPDPRPDHYIERAELLREDGRLEEAIRGLEEGLHRIGPALPLHLAILDLELEAGRYDDALGRAARIQGSSERKDLWTIRRAEILARAGRAAEAAAAYRSALALMEALPAGRRSTKFTRDLESQARAALEVLR